MSTQRNVLMTGITSGMGLEAARYLMQSKTVHVVTGVRSPDRRGVLGSLPQDRLTILDLDLASLESVRAFCDGVSAWLGGQTLDAMALNAGIQITAGLEMTDDGIEKTFAVNHLGHWLIRNTLSDKLAPMARVVLTCSGTHDPGDPIAKRFGFRGGVFPSADAVAVGTLDPTAKPAQACLDRYATSKMCNVMQGLRWAHDDPERITILYDPGLMPGTDLARDRNAVERFAWTYVMPALRFAMKGVSTPHRSGQMLAKLLTGERAAKSGAYVEFSGREIEPWDKAKDAALQADLDALSRRLTETVA